MITAVVYLVASQVVFDASARRALLSPDAGTFTGTRMVNGALVLDVNQTTGTWRSPVYDTQQTGVLWEWLTARAELAGVQENLAPNPGYEADVCNGAPTVWSGVRFQTPPRVDCTTAASGTKSMAIVATASPRSEYWATVCGPEVQLPPAAIAHVDFSLKLDTDEQPLALSLMPVKAADGQTDGHRWIAEYKAPLRAFEEQSYTVSLEQLRPAGHPAYRGFIPCFVVPWTNTDRPLRAWVDDWRIYWRSPVSFRARSSLDGVTWNDWSEPRFLLARKTAPGTEPGRYFQVEVSLNTPSAFVAPSVRDLELSYTRAFQFPVTFGPSAPSPIDAPVDPVGVHGFVRRTPSGHLEFGDGAPVRFWATQLGSDAPWSLSHSESEALCARLRRFGFNLLKLTPPPGPSDAFDYLLKACAGEGIYVTLQLNGGNTTVERLSPAGWWNLEAHVRQTLMVHVNPYRGLMLASDPQLVAVQLFNEETALGLWAPGAASPWKDAAWRDWLQQRYGNTGTLTAAWSDGTGQALIPGEVNSNPLDFTQVARNIFQRLDPNDWLVNSDARFADGTRFHAGLWKNAYDHFQSFVPDAGVRALVIANNEYYGLAELAARVNTDVLDHHPYFDNMLVPETGGEWIRQLPESKSPFSNIVAETSQNKLAGRPLFASESNTQSPSLYGAELPLFAGAYSSFQDWDNWTLFALSLKSPTLAQTPYSHVSGFDPVKMFQMPAASRLFRERQVRPAVKSIDIEHTEVTTAGYKLSRTFENWCVPGLPSDYVFKHRVQRVRFDAGVEKTAADYVALFALGPPANDAGVYVSDTGELVLDSVQGALRIDSPKAKAFAGFTTPQPVVLGEVTLEPAASVSGYAAVSLVALDDAAISGSRRLLLTAVGRGEAGGARWNSEKSGLTNPGDHFTEVHSGGGPVWVEGINARVTLRVPASAVSVRRLDPDGQPGAALTVGGGPGAFTFAIDEAHQTLWYLVETMKPLDAGTLLPDAGTPSLDAGSALDAGTGPLDAGSAADGGAVADGGRVIDAGEKPLVMPPPEPTPGACGCGSPGLGPLVLALLLALRRLRR